MSDRRTDQLRDRARAVSLIAPVEHNSYLGTAGLGGRHHPPDTPAAQPQKPNLRQLPKRPERAAHGAFFCGGVNVFFQRMNVGGGRGLFATHRDAMRLSNE